MPRLVPLLFLLSAAIAAAADRPPNVVLILADDQGTFDLDVYGSDDLETPNLDALAGRGVRFSQFYVAAPVCSPSRAAILTGRVPMRAGVPGNVGIGARGLPPEEVTIAEMLHGAGYRTALFGKWHLGYAVERGPRDQGFDEFFGHHRGCIDNYSHFFYWSGPNNHDLWRNETEVWEDGTHFSDLIVREANEFIETNRDQPFFLYLPFNIPHYPMQGTPHWRERYRNLPTPRKEYAALVSTLDEHVGRVLAKLDALGLRENTLVIYLSDHGHSTEERALFGGGNPGPYRGAKFSLFEAGLRVPAIISLPGKLPSNEVRDQFAVSVDLLPTIAELTATPTPERKLDGRSLVPVLKDGASADSREFHWQQGPQWAARDGDWKLVVNARDTDRSEVQGDEQVFLSDLSHDATERANLAAAHPEVVKRLTALHEAWLADVAQRDR